MRKEAHLRHLLDLKDTQGVFWWLMPNVNRNSVCLQGNSTGHRKLSLTVNSIYMHFVTRPDSICLLCTEDADMNFPCGDIRRNLQSLCSGIVLHNHCLSISCAAILTSTIWCIQVYSRPISTRHSFTPQLYSCQMLFAAAAPSTTPLCCLSVSVVLINI